MSGIVTAAASAQSCSHHQVSVTLDGEAIDLGTVSNAYLDSLPWGTAEKTQFLIQCLKWKRVGGVSVAALLGRVLAGDEATNVKQYYFCGPGVAITKTNIGTSYVNVCPGLNGERVLVDCKGCTEMRIVLTANLVGVGPFKARIVRDSDNTIFYENASIAQTGERELDTDWVAIPAWATNLEVLRAQMASVTATDDPIIRRLALLVR